MSEDLKPCPFCGRAPITMDRADGFSKTGHIWVISCMCGGFSARAHQLRDNKDDVVAAWNHRYEENNG
jgi:Lar family restriction alleviation protein